MKTPSTTITMDGVTLSKKPTKKPRHLLENTPATMQTTE